MRGGSEQAQAVAMLARAHKLQALMMTYAHMRISHHRTSGDMPSSTGSSFTKTHG